MKVYKRKEKICNGITCLSSNGKNSFIGGVDNDFFVLNQNYDLESTVNIPMGSVNCVYSSGSLIKRNSCKFI